MTFASDDTVPVADSASASAAPGDDDRRTRLPEPLPVWLIAVEDMHVLANAGVERDLDAFYVDLLGFERDGNDLIYRADNARLVFKVKEPPFARDGVRPIGIEVLSLREIEHRLIELQTEYVREKGLFRGLDTMLLRDPAGNWIELSQRREIW